MDNSFLSLSPEDFSTSLEKELSPYVKNRIKDYDFKYYEMSYDEHNATILRIVNTLKDDSLVRAGAHRIDQWENGWSQNYDQFEKQADHDAIIPGYFNKFNILRWQGKFIKPQSPQFELNMLGIIIDWLADKYMRDVAAVYEFGCGTGHHLKRIREVNKSADIWGLDWVESSQKIIAAFAKTVSDDKLHGHRFDYYNPDYSFDLKENSIVYTVASLEQIGSSHDAFINYLLAKKPKICVHIEPIAELLDEENLLDNLSIEYFKKRNYLSGFLTKLRDLEVEGRVKINRSQRTHIGSLFIEGYSVVVWSPV